MSCKLRPQALHSFCLQAATTEDATPLHYAAASGHRGVAELLLDAGAEADRRSRDGATPLLTAAGRQGRLCAAMPAFVRLPHGALSRVLQRHRRHLPARLPVCLLVCAACPALLPHAWQRTLQRSGPSLHSARLLCTPPSVAGALVRL